MMNELEYVSLGSLDFLQKYVCLGMPGIFYDYLYQFPRINQEIAQGKQIHYELLYQGTRDGLKSDPYQDKCSGEANLLTIMTSQNIIDQYFNIFVKENTRKSFLFQYNRIKLQQYNKKDIQAIKNQEEAVYYNHQYRPTYGGHDFGIHSNFLEGYSHLGISYGVLKYKIVDPQEHHFGETIQRQIECKVYKVIF